jgi:hypothetical protein
MENIVMPKSYSSPKAAPRKGVDIPFDEPSASDKSPEGKLRYQKSLENLDARREAQRQKYLKGKYVEQSKTPLPGSRKQYKT